MSRSVSLDCASKHAPGKPDLTLLCVVLGLRWIGRKPAIAGRLRPTLELLIRRSLRRQWLIVHAGHDQPPCSLSRSSTPQEYPTTSPGRNQVPCLDPAPDCQCMHQSISIGIGVTNLCQDNQECLEISFGDTGRSAFRWRETAFLQPSEQVNTCILAFGMLASPEPIKNTLHACVRIHRNPL